MIPNISLAKQMRIEGLLEEEEKRKLEESKIKAREERKKKELQELINSRVTKIIEEIGRDIKYAFKKGNNTLIYNDSYTYGEFNTYEEYIEHIHNKVRSALCKAKYTVNIDIDNKQKWNVNYKSAFDIEYTDVIGWKYPITISGWSFD